ncbi:MAG: hypothetical protein GC151_10585 [Betaproteobacteria bacterium]|nr:hypothetical protein [Betaproteobacteria bacterium]
MTREEFQASLTSSSPPAELNASLAALWWCATGDWARAHAIAQSDDSAAGAWVHAHLHRVEGDLGNAGYWYRRARRPVASGDLDAERGEIVTALLASGGESSA